MGILNLTPDSFSDGGKFNKKNKSLIHILNMIKSGANIIDVGGESTRPGSKTIQPALEWERIKYVLKNFKKKFKKSCLSLDTRKSDLMIKGIKNGVDLINTFRYPRNIKDRTDVDHQFKSALNSVIAGCCWSASRINSFNDHLSKVL